MGCIDQEPDLPRGTSSQKKSGGVEAEKAPICVSSFISATLSISEMETCALNNNNVISNRHDLEIMRRMKEHEKVRDRDRVKAERHEL